MFFDDHISYSTRKNDTSTIKHLRLLSYFAYIYFIQVPLNMSKWTVGISIHSHTFPSVFKHFCFWTNFSPTVRYVYTVYGSHECKKVHKHINNIFQRKSTWISTKVILATFSSAVMFKRQAQTMYLLIQKTAIDFDTSIELMCLNVCSSLCVSMRECVFVCMCKRENGWAYVIMLNYTYYISKWLEYSYPDYWFTKYSFALFLYLFAIRFAALGYGAVLVWLRILCCQSTSMWIDIKFTIIGIGIALTEHHFNMY